MICKASNFKGTQRPRRWAGAKSANNISASCPGTHPRLAYPAVLGVVVKVRVSVVGDPKGLCAVADVAHDAAAAGTAVVHRSEVVVVEPPAVERAPRRVPKVVVANVTII